ncbi:recombinase XerD [Salibacterium salarium]|uniref:Recombinase XerD n=1 Tax=Salibacterium salarium TaxID=284579 RepID=A0A3R9P1J8_9BACI|nr:tyrosine-type recombinase/integrase [Salibacterium salarium]RSL28889.1 recombinase XerD [Salibacterium salarium]
MARRKNVINEDSLEEKAVVDAEDFETSTHAFLRDCKIRNLSEESVKFYDKELRGVLRLLEAADADTHPQKIDAESIRNNIILAMMESGAKEGAINARLRGLRTFLNYLVREGILDHSPMKKVGLIRQKKTIIEAFSRQQLRLLFAAADDGTFTGFRDKTAMMLLFETGLRSNEMVNVKVSDIKWEHNVIDVHHPKNYRERTVPFQTTMKRQLRKYVALRGKLENDFLFVTIDNTPLTKRQLQNRINHYGVKAGIKDVRTSPHTFRHSFAKYSVLNGADMFTLQKILGHSSLEMVRVYVELFSPEIMENHRKFSPIEKLF